MTAICPVFHREKGIGTAALAKCREHEGRFGMSFRFIHTADWQIGKPFASFPDGLAGELAAARLEIMPRIAAIARMHGAAHVLVAGDVFDSDSLDTLALRRTLEHLRTEEDVCWLLLPGNHDPARPGGVWERLMRIGLPVNVAVLTEPAPYQLQAGTVVLPAPLTSRSPGIDPTAWMTGAATAGGVARIGLAHGSVQGFGSEGESAVAISRDRAKSAGLSYLALGDWHGTTSIDTRTHYSGTPEPDRLPDNNPGNVLVVSVDGEAPPAVSVVPSAIFKWARIAAQVHDHADLAAVERTMTGLSPSLRHVIVRLKLDGSLTLSGQAALDTWQAEWEGRLRHLETDRTSLKIRASGADLDTFGSCGGLRDAANGLAQQAASGNEIAQLALQKLFQFAAAAQADAP